MRIRVGERLLLNAGVWFVLAALAGGSAQAETSGAEFFEKNVRPLFVQRCFACHGSGGSPMGGLRLDNREAILQGGGRGPALVAGKPNESLLIHALQQTDASLKMPPGKKVNGR